MASSTASRPVPQTMPYPRGLVRLVYKLPLTAYRMGFGDTLNLVRIMVMTTRGRKSGMSRYTAIEYRQHGRKTYVLAGWLESDWLKNLRTDPVCLIQQGRRQFTAHAVFLDDPAETRRALTLFRRTASLSTPLIDYVETDAAGSVVIVRFDPQPAETDLVPLAASQVWIVPTLIGLSVFVTLGLAALRLRRPQRLTDWSDDRR